MTSLNAEPQVLGSLYGSQCTSEMPKKTGKMCDQVHKEKRKIRGGPFGSQCRSEIPQNKNVTVHKSQVQGDLLSCAPCHYFFLMRYYLLKLVRALKIV